MRRFLPENVSAGLSFSASATLPAVYDGWDVVLFLRGPKSVDLEGVRSGSSVAFYAAGDTTAEWAPGAYAYSVRATNGGDVVEVDAGALSVAPDFAQLPDGYDPRSQWEIGLEAIEAVLGKRATLDQDRYRINNRELYRTSVSELLKLRAFYAQKVMEQKGGRGRFKEYKVAMRPMGSR